MNSVIEKKILDKILEFLVIKLGDGGGGGGKGKLGPFQIVTFICVKLLLAFFSEK